jgi:hypothetical protein
MPQTFVLYTDVKYIETTYNEEQTQKVHEVPH